jgi:signal peptidase I
VTTEKRTGNPFIAALLSLIVPGLGQIHNGRGAQGLGFILLSVALPLLWGASGWPRRFSGLVAFVLAEIVFWLFVVVHAFIQARRTGETERKKYQTATVYAFLVILCLGAMILVPARIWMDFWGVSPYRLGTDAMMPTLQKGDCLMTDPDAYDGQAPKRGALVVFVYPRDPTKQYLKRVIATEGETVEIHNKQVFIDGEPLQEPYKVHIDTHVHTESDLGNYEDIIRDNYGPATVPPGHCFVMGDNRDNSLDSRYRGFLPLANVKGQALYVYWAKDKKRIGLTVQ